MNKLLAMGTKFSLASRSRPASVTTLQHLPPKLRRIILNHLSWTDMLSARLVSRQWYVDSTFQSRWFGTIDETTTDDDDVQLNCLCIRIVRLTSPQTRFETLFPHPSNVLVLIIDEVSLDHLLTLLKYLPSLDKLKLCTNKVISVNNKMKAEQWHQKDDCFLPMSASLDDVVASKILTKISIRGPCGDSVERLMCPSRKIFRRFLQSKFSSLKCFELMNVECNQYDESSYTILILVFIGHHSSTLKNLSIRMTSVPLVKSQDNYKCQLLSVPDEAIPETRLNKLAIQPLTSGIGGIYWLHLMQGQSLLEKLHGHFLAAPFSLYRSVINRNFKTLISINLTQLSLCESINPDPTHIRPLRLSIFLKCKALKSLSLERFEHDQVSLEIDYPSEITYTSSLPSSLESLKISGFRMRQQDILEFCTGTLENLQSLTLINCGLSTACGVHVTTLQNILNTSSRMKLKYFCVQPLVILTAADVEKLEQIARIIEQPLDHFFAMKEKKIEWRLKVTESKVTPGESPQSKFEPKIGSILWLMLNLNNFRTRVGRSFLNTMKDIFKHFHPSNPCDLSNFKQY